MITAKEYILEFLHSNKKYSITYFVLTVPYKKDHLMYRLSFPVKNGGKKEFVFFKDKAGQFSGSRKDIKPVLMTALKEIVRSEKQGTQIIKVRPH